MTRAKKERVATAIQKSREVSIPRAPQMVLRMKITPAPPMSTARDPMRLFRSRNESIETGSPLTSSCERLFSKR